MCAHDPVTDWFFYANEEQRHKEGWRYKGWLVGVNGQPPAGMTIVEKVRGTLEEVRKRFFELTGGLTFGR